MNGRFSKFAVLALVAAGLGFAQGQTAKTARIDGQAQRIFQEATRRIVGYETIEAKLRVRTDLMGQRLVGSGEYAQLRATSGLLLRMELAIQAGGQASSVKQICNGPDLWEHWRFGDKEKLHHVDLRRVEQGLATALSSASEHAAEEQIGSDAAGRVPTPDGGSRTRLDAPSNPSGGPTLRSATSNLARGGLPKLLSQLDRNFDFSKSPPETDSISDVKTWVVTGVWKQDQLERIAPEAVENGRIVFGKVPVHLPHQVQIQFDQRDLFPYRIDYQRWSPPVGSDDGGMKAVVTTEFYEVALNASLDPTQFNYQQPANVSIADRTDAFLKSLGLAHRPTAAQQR